ncbi:MAG: CPXCG motif-containing cysteine-rich protein [Xanthomonadales bacterium]|nr:CPXCG motif-containing cysteine-rich protein [Xanthomonadales bacterium]
MTSVFVRLHCPYCGECFDSAADPGGGEIQQYIEDCAVCCRPISVRLRLDDDGGVGVATRREDEA